MGNPYQDYLYQERDRLLNKYQNEVDPALKEYLTTGGSSNNLSPEQLLARYGSISKGPEELRRYTQGIWDWNPAAFAQDSTNQYAYDTFKSIFGRDPSATEYSQILPIFGGAEGRQRGAAAVSQMFDAYKQSPEYLKTQAGQYSDELAPIYRDLLGRDARQDELDYYGQQLAGGRSEYEIRQLLQQLPEYRTAEDQKFRTGLASELEGYDTSFFDKAKENVISRSKRQGGGVSTSSALDFALTNLMGDIAEKRGGYLANLSAQQYGGNKEAAREDYRTSMNRYFEDQDYNQRRTDADRDYYRSRSDEDRDYTRQWNDYMGFMNSQKPGSALHTRDWIDIGLNGINTGTRAYMASQGGGGGRYGYLNQ